jgi:deazaflavin-dependent oxidoreductase (nitroreductase family)
MNPMTRLAIVLGRQPWMPRLLPQIVWLDQTIHRLTRGRFSLLSLAGLPELFLTVRGRKSGEPRTTPLLCVPHNGSFLVAGSNWGAPKLPIWVLNLRDAGQAVVDFKGHKTHVSARQADGDERARLWAVMNRTWPNYDHYASRTDREIPVFVLTPA